MSKKSKQRKLKKKFKKLLKQKMAEQERAIEAPKRPSSILPVPTQPNKAELAPEPTKSETKSQTLTTILNPHIKSDLIRIAIFLSIFVVLLIATAIINQKTTWLAILANKIYLALHLG